MSLDEFVTQLLVQYDGKLFKSINAEDALPESDEEKAEAEAKNKANTFVVDFVKKCLGEKVADVRISRILKSQPVCMVADGPHLPGDGKVLQPPRQRSPGYKAQRVLELNADSDAYKALKEAIIDDEEKAKLYTNLLYNQALIIAGPAPGQCQAAISPLTSAS